MLGAVAALSTAALFGVPGGCTAGRGGEAAFGRRAAAPMPEVVRAVWVARFHYRTPDDIREIMHNCAEGGFNTVLFQVRGDATVAYPSKLEPWSTEYNHRDPGFDPLRLAVDEAHRRGLRIEAWVNVMPGWFGPHPPLPRQHVYHAHPEWFLYDEAGRRQPLNDHYVILNPCLPAVREHIVRVFEEIATRYDVDGLHLDYVRYAWDRTPGAAQRYPRDAATLALYRRHTGRHPDDDPQAWHRWRANQLTRLVDETRRMLRARRPGAALTAAVWGDPRDGYRDYLQNATAWLSAGLIDAAYPMAYRDDVRRFEGDVAAYRRAAPGRRVVPGIGAYKLGSAAAVSAQLARCEGWGGDFALFSYESLFETWKDRLTRPDARTRAERDVRRGVLAGFVRGGPRP